MRVPKLGFKEVPSAQNPCHYRDMRNELATLPDGGYRVKQIDEITTIDPP